MNQRGFLIKVGTILKRYEQNKRQMIKNQDALLPGNKMATEDFDVFDQWFGRQRKVIRDYLGAEDHEELRGLRQFFKQETDVPQIHLHFDIWSSLSKSDNKVTLERLSRLIHEYHVSRTSYLCTEDDGSIKTYQSCLVREHDIIRQIDRARQTYHDHILVLRKFKAKQDHVCLNMEGDYYNQRKVIHEARIVKKTYEDILRFEAGKSRADLMKITHELVRLIRLEEEKRLTQLMAIIEEYFRLQLSSADMNNARRDALRHQMKHLKVIGVKIRDMVKVWMRSHHKAVEYPEFQEPTDGVVQMSQGTADILRTIKEELSALQARLSDSAPKGDVIYLSASKDSMDEDFHRPEEKCRESLFQSASDSTQKKPVEASDLSVEDVEEKDSTHVFYPSVTSSSRAFTVANQRRRQVSNPSQRPKSVYGSTLGGCHVVPGTIVSEDEVASPSNRPYTRQTTLSSSEEDVSDGEGRKMATAPNKDEVVPFRQSLNDKGPDLRLSKLSGIYVVAKRSYLATCPKELSFNAGDIIKQERACDSRGMAYGYKKSRFGPKISGFYPVNNVRFHRFGSKTNETI